jgi:hypothetical protein
LHRRWEIRFKSAKPTEYLKKLGVTKQLIHVCKKPYARFTMDVEGIFPFLSTIGVRQGDSTR